MSPRTAIINARLYSDKDGRADCSLLIADGKIERISRGTTESDADRVIDAAGRILAPGYIDVHIHGAGGKDSLDGDLQAMQTISRTIAAMGTTGFVTTTFAQPESDHSHLRGIAPLVNTNLGGASLLGIHMEGPFINLKRKGGIPPEVIYPHSENELEVILEAADGTLRIMTIAPELRGNLELIRRLDQEGVVPSVGHSDASYLETLRGFEAGIRHATHLYNAMPGLHHRDPGPLLAIFENPEITAELIADGAHVGSDMTRWTGRYLGPDRVICVTDGMQGTGLPEGRYLFNGREYDSHGGSARYVENGGLIGTTLGLAEILRRFIEWTGLPLADAVKTVAYNPARMLGLDHRKGSIEVGKDADFVLLDDDLNVTLTLVEGRIVFDNRKDAAASASGFTRESPSH